MNLERDVAPTGFYDALPKFPRRRGKTPRKSTIGKLKPGLLKAVGYSVTDRTTRRRKAVKRAVAKYGRSSTIKKLNAVAVYTRRTSPAKSKRFKADMKIAQRMKGGIRTLQQIKDDLSTIMGEAGGEETMETPQAIVDEVRGLGVNLSNGTTVGAVHSAVKNAIMGR